MNEYSHEMFSQELQSQIKNKFYFVNYDPYTKKDRLFFENAGGSYRLKAAVEMGSIKDAMPDCPDRSHKAARYLNDVLEQGVLDIRTIFNAKRGIIAFELTASQMMFNMVKTIAENVEGTNMVTTALEHPSAFDAVNYYTNKLGKELRVAGTNNETGGVDPKEILKLIDKDTILLSVMYASNFTGAVLDIETIVREARKIKPDLFIVIDAVQHAAHGIIDIEKTPVDGMNFGAYKFFGCRGIGVGYLSDRLSKLSHHKILEKPVDEWRLGSPVPLQLASISEVVNYVCWIGSKFTDKTNKRELYVEGMTRIKLHERALLDRMLNGTEEVKGLRYIKGVTVYPDCKDLTNRDLILPIGFEKVSYEQAVDEYEKRGVIVRESQKSSMFFRRILEAFGMEGALRVSPLHCNSPEDIDLFLKITQEIVQSC
ncbi:MAG: aminotransferase class V-fold PLP-dependent enzyme [Lutisporaceae bacterium]